MDKKTTQLGYRVSTQVKEDYDKLCDKLRFNKSGKIELMMIEFIEKEKQKEGS